MKETERVPGNQVSLLTHEVLLIYLNFEMNIKVDVPRSQRNCLPPKDLSD